MQKLKKKTQNRTKRLINYKIYQVNINQNYTIQKNMLQEIEVESVKLVREVELFENQRYGVTQFSHGALMPNDRNAYSSRDGTIGWANTQLASEAFCQPNSGWQWVEGSEWSLEVVHGQTDEEGWTYSRDFASIESAVGKKGMTHFVRRRRYLRSMGFLGNIPNLVLINELLLLKFLL